MQRRILFLRHAMTQGNIEKRYVGTTDEEILPSEKDFLQNLSKQNPIGQYHSEQNFIEQNLSEQNLSEQNLIGQNLSEQNLSGQNLVGQNRFLESTNNLIITSSAKRCIETCTFLFDGREPDIFSKALGEMDFGDFEYKNFHELDGNPFYQKYIDSNGECGFPNGESKKEFIKRVSDEFVKILTMVPKDERDLIFIVHGGTIMAILSKFALPQQDYFSYHCDSLSGFRGILEYDINDKNSVAISELCKFNISKNP